MYILKNITDNKDMIDFQSTTNKYEIKNIKKFKTFKIVINTERYLRAMQIEIIKNCTSL